MSTETWDDLTITRVAQFNKDIQLITAEIEVEWRSLIAWEDALSLVDDPADSDAPADCDLSVVLPLARVSTIKDWLHTSDIQHKLSMPQYFERVLGDGFTFDRRNDHKIPSWFRISFMNREDAVMCRLAWL